ncbi:MAG: hypothetical protein GY859_14210 [Desulfobacterales bacterium]|nr:hypothetical protein [Desulfobacterales bacterium]
MIDKGIQMTLHIGPDPPNPAPAWLLESLDNVEVTHGERGRSGFQISFEVERTGPADQRDFQALSGPLLKPFNRVILTVAFQGVPRVLMDGFITHRQLTPGGGENASSLVITGEDVSLMMDMKARRAEHPAQAETVIALKIILSYAQYGLIPRIIPPTTTDVPNPVDRTPAQHCTDLKYIEEMARRHGHIFYVIPGPAPMANTAYWGPPVREGAAQPVLSVDMGPYTNVTSINFSDNRLAPTMVSGRIQDRNTNESMPVEPTGSTRPPLSSQPAWGANPDHIRRVGFRRSGLDAARARARAQGEVDQSMDEVLTANGELDASRYGGLLEPHRLVELRGAGFEHDGLYHVKNVTHAIRVGEYKQRFTLTREGTGAKTSGA